MIYHMFPRASTVFFNISLYTCLISSNLYPDTVMNQTTTTTTIESFKEIATRSNPEIATHFKQLTQAERIFVYYLLRASLPGNRIAVDQIHRTGIETIALFELLLKNESNIRDILAKHPNKNSFDSDTFFQELKIFCAYLWTNHGQYYLKEHDHEKRTPKRLGLTLLTHENIAEMLDLLSFDDQREQFDRLAPLIFDELLEPTNTIQNSIDQSSVNMYARDFTEDDFAELSLHDRARLNSYCYIETNDNKRVPRVAAYKIGGKYDQELRVAHTWLSRALDHAQNYPEHFDQYLIESLKHLLDYLTTGDEEYFKKHSKAWLKSNSRIDYTFGFIETYKDPKSYRGMFAAEATIKTVDIQSLNALLPAIEESLPFPAAFKRDVNGASGLPNASINRQFFGTGEFGPLYVTAAYCLPNYSEIRSQYGSKQIIYHPEKSTGELLNPDLARKLFHLADDATFLATHDTEGALHRDIWTIQCILHETLGHGSGKLSVHTFNEHENRTIGNVTYQIGDTIPVTSENLPELLDGYEHTLEELRAEIIALYVSVFHFDEIAASGLLGKWPTLLGKEQMINHLIIGMATTGLNRLLAQQDNATIISGDHARANTTILNYLIDHGGIAIQEETLNLDGKTHTVLGIIVNDIEKARAGIRDLMVLVQNIKSTGDGMSAKELIGTYGVIIRNVKHLQALKENQRAVMGEIKAMASLYPIMTPQFDDTGKIIDITIRFPKDLIEQQLLYSELALSEQ